MESRQDRLADLRNLRYANLDGAFATAFVTLVGGNFLISFVKFLADNPREADRWIGLLSGAPSLIGLLVIPGAVWGRRFGTYKHFVMVGGRLWRLAHLPLVFMPLLAGLSGNLRLTIVVSCIIFASICVQLVNPIYNDWLAELVPQNSRGWYFSRRGAIAAGVGAVAGLAGGFGFDAFKRTGHEAVGYTVIFGLGMVFSLISLVLYGKMTDRVRQNPERVSLRESLTSIAAPFSDRNFRIILIFLCVFVAGQTLGGSLYSAYALESMHMPLGVIQMLGATHAIGNIIAARMWGNLADKYGNKPILFLLGIGLGLTPIMWIMTQPNNLVFSSIILLVGHVFAGIIWGGVAVCQFNLLLNAAPPEKRANYIGAGLATQALIGGVAPMVGAEVMHNLARSMHAADAYKWIFIATSGLRLFSILFLLPVREEGSQSVGSTLNQLRRISPSGYRAIKRMQTPDVQTRESAIQSITDLSFEVGSDELVRALSDPSSRIRRRAAIALGRLGDEKSVAALLDHVRDHPDLVEDEMIDALGESGSPSTAPVLIQFLESPRPQVRRAAARALGMIDSVESISPLIEAASMTGDPDLRRSALQALRRREVRLDGALLADALLDEHTSVRIAAAELVADLELDNTKSILHDSLSQYQDEAASEVAYALGVVGDHADISAILSTANSTKSAIARRRCLLGVARIFGVERETYKLMLLEGMSRDSALLAMVQKSGRSSPRLRVALEKYSQGDEAEALQHILKMKGGSAFRPFVETPVPGAFLIAILAISRGLENSPPIADKDDASL